MKTVTVQSLIDLRACNYQIELFQETFGNSCELTRENLQRASEVKLDLIWWIQKVYGKQVAKLHWDAYATEMKPHWDAYCTAIQPHEDAYLTIKKQYYDASWAVRKPHWDVYCTAIKPHVDAYLAAKKLCWKVYQNSLIEFVLNQLNIQG